MNFLAGMQIGEGAEGQSPMRSNYQVMRLATEIVPAYAAVLGPR